MKKIYESPVLEISSLSKDDIVVVSGSEDWFGEEDVFGE